MTTLSGPAVSTRAPDAGARSSSASSFRFDRRLFEDDVTGSLAWARALGARRRAVAPTRRGRSSGARRRSSSGAARIRRSSTGADEDVHSFVERLLVERLGDAGRRLHTGRSRNEQVSLDLRLYLRRRIPLLQRGVAARRRGAGRPGRPAGDALMPAFTHFRPAQPVLVAHFFLAHVGAAAARLTSGSRPRAPKPTRCRSARAPIAGTSYAIDVEALARDLGFSRVVANSIDASSDRDFAATFLYACAMTMVHLSRLAED